MRLRLRACGRWRAANEPKRQAITRIEQDDEKRCLQGINSKQASEVLLLVGGILMFVHIGAGLADAESTNTSRLMSTVTAVRRVDMRLILSNAPTPPTPSPDAGKVVGDGHVLMSEANRNL